MTERRVRRFGLSAELLAEMFQTGRHHNFVIKAGLPEDAKILGTKAMGSRAFEITDARGWRSMTFWLFIESATFDLAAFGGTEESPGSLAEIPIFDIQVERVEPLYGYLDPLAMVDVILARSAPLAAGQ